MISAINTPESSNHFTISIISFISFFELNEANLFPALAAPFPPIFLSKLFIGFEVKLLTNPGKSFLAKRTAIFVSAVFPKLPNQEPKDPRDGVILDISFLLSLILLLVLYYY